MQQMQRADAAASYQMQQMQHADAGSTIASDRPPADAGLRTPPQGAGDVPTPTTSEGAGDAHAAAISYWAYQRGFIAGLRAGIHWGPAHAADLADAADAAHAATISSGYCCYHMQSFCENLQQQAQAAAAGDAAATTEAATTEAADAADAASDKTDDYAGDAASDKTDDYAAEADDAADAA